MTEPEPIPEAAERSEPTPAARDLPLSWQLWLMPPLLFLFAQVPHIIERMRAGLGYPFEMDGEEGFVFFQAIRLFTGRHIYTAIAHEPWLVSNYPPLFPWGVSRMLSPERLGLPVGRLLVAVMAAHAALMMIMIVSTRTRRMLTPLLAPLLLLVSYEFHNWAPFCRVDIPAISLTLTGLMLFACFETPWATLAAALVFVAAGFTKQTAFLAPLACIVALLFNDRRRLLWFLLPYAAVGGGIFLWINHATGGEFARHTITYNNNVMDWGQLRAILKNEIWYFQRFWICGLIAGAAALLLAMRAARRDGSVGWERFQQPRHARGAVGIYALLAGLSLVSFAKAGSAPNYGLEPLAAGAIAGCETLARLFDLAGGTESRRRRIARAGAIAMLAAVFLHAWRVQQTGAAMFSSPTPGRPDVDAGKTVLKVMQDTPGPVLSEFPIFPILLGRPVVIQPFIMSRLAREGMWDQTPLVDQIRAKKFGLIITAQNLERAGDEAILRWTPEMVRAITAHYRLGYVLGPGAGMIESRQRYFVWTPADAEESPMDDSQHVAALDCPQRLDSGSAL